MNTYLHTNIYTDTSHITHTHTERERERERDRQTERDRERQRQRYRERERESHNLGKMDGSLLCPQIYVL